MSESVETSRAIEAVLMVADQPVPVEHLVSIIGVSVEEIEIEIAELIRSYAADNRGFILQRVAGGFRYQSHHDLATIVERFVLDGQVARLSAAALETLAIIAYKQPISRNQISAIRGVNAEGVVRTLEARGYVEEIGRDPGPGRASLYGTTASFLERLGLDSVAELPPLGQFVPGADVVEALETTLLANPEPIAEAELAAELAVDEPEDVPGEEVDAGPIDGAAMAAEMAAESDDEIEVDDLVDET